MALKVELNGGPDAPSTWTDITDQVKVFSGMRVGGNAHLGEIGTGSGFDLDDDAGDLLLPVKRVVRIRDTKTSPDTILVRGRIADKNVRRGGGGHVDDARGYDVQLDDGNAELRGIPIRKWARPSETDYKRVIALWRRYLKGSPRATTRLRIDYVRNANRVILPRQVYRDTDPYGVFRDIGEAAGKEFFVTVDGELFYDLPLSQRYSSDLLITDEDPNDSDEFPPDAGATGNQDGTEFLSGVVVTYGRNKRVARVRSSVEENHDFWREIIPEDATGAADAAKRTKALLSRQAREDRTYTVVLDLTDDQVDLIKYGQTVSFESSATGVKTPVVLRVGRLLWEPVAPRRYRAHLELGFPKKLVPRIRRDRGDNPANRTPPQGDEVTPSDAVTDHRLDDFLRDDGSNIMGFEQGHSSGSSHSIVLPDGSGYPGGVVGGDLVDRQLFVFMMTVDEVPGAGGGVDLMPSPWELITGGTIPCTHGFFPFNAGHPNMQTRVWRYDVDAQAGEPWEYPSTGATVVLASDEATEVLWVAVLVGGVGPGDLETGPGSTDWDIPDWSTGLPSVATGNRAIYFSLAFNRAWSHVGRGLGLTPEDHDTSIVTGIPDGFTRLTQAVGGEKTMNVDYAFSPIDEGAGLPTLSLTGYIGTGGSQDFILTRQLGIEVNTSGAVDLGDILTSAENGGSWWPGGNPWLPVEPVTASFSTDPTDGLEITDGLLVARLYDVDDGLPNTGGRLPFELTSWSKRTRLRISTIAAEDNVWGVDWRQAGRAMGFRVFLGTGGALGATGLALIGDSTSTDTVALSGATDYWARTEVDGTAAMGRIRIWEGGIDDEPTSWNLELALGETADGDLWQFFGEIVDASATLRITPMEVQAPDDSRQGHVGEVYGLTATPGVA